MEIGQTFRATGAAAPGPNPGLAKSRRQQPHTKALALGTPAALALPIALSPGSLHLKWGLVSFLAISTAQKLFSGEHQKAIAAKVILPAPLLQERRAAA